MMTDPIVISILTASLVVVWVAAHQMARANAQIKQAEHLDRLQKQIDGYEPPGADIDRLQERVEALTRAREHFPAAPTRIEPVIPPWVGDGPPVADAGYREPAAAPVEPAPIAPRPMPEKPRS